MKITKQIMAILTPIKKGVLESLGRFRLHIVTTCNDCGNQVSSVFKKYRPGHSKSINNRSVLKHDISSEYGKPVNGSVPFDEFWEVKPGTKSYQDTVDHRLMVVKSSVALDTEVTSPDSAETLISGTWHVKGPGKESIGTRLKRVVQKLAYIATLKMHKAGFYRDSKLLIQKEIMATSLYKEAMKTITSEEADSMKDYQAHYTVDLQNKRSFGAFKHLEGFQDLADLDCKTIEIDHKYHFATALVFRRFFVGDEDYLKLDNYMYDNNNKRLYAIDFGMAFYNKVLLDKNTDFDSFKAQMLKPSRKHRLQYRDKDNLMTAIKSGSDDEVTEGIKKGLVMVANLEDTVLKQQAKVISKDVARDSMLAILKARRDQARCILYESFPQDFAAYSDTQWPSLSMRKAMNRSV